MPEKHLKFHSENGKRNVLIIEDEFINRELLRMALQDTYELLFAERGDEALDKLREHHEKLSIVLLDLNLPDMNGTDILKRIKEDGSTARLPVIVMTADQEAEVQCLGMGANDFIPKPYPKQEIILARIRRTIELSEDRDIILWTEREQLTGLYNREYFYRYAAQFDRFHKDTPTDAIVVDINRFHMLNERYGRAFGDEILKQVAGKLLDAVGEHDGIVCRRSADTFYIYCPHRTDYTEIIESASVDLDDKNRVSLRMGVYPEVDKTLEMELRFDRAKLAADKIRGSATTAVSFFDRSMHDREVLTDQLLSEFGAAISDKQLMVYYQPKFNIQDEQPRLASAEALVRWKHPELGMVSPGCFVPLFEENGLIRELDSFVWREAAAHVREWKDELGRTIPVSVNVSRVDLNDEMLLEELEGILAETGLAHDDLLLEITESAYTEDSERIISVVENLQKNGFHIEMDDFGTGYSSLNMISAMPIDILKIDMQFIRGAFTESKDTRLLHAIMGLAKSFELPTIAEGVETEEQVLALKDMGCDVVQGYYFSKPIPADEFEEYVRGLKDMDDAEDSEDAGSEGAE